MESETLTYSRTENIKSVIASRPAGKKPPPVPEATEAELEKLHAWVIEAKARITDMQAQFAEWRDYFEARDATATKLAVNELAHGADPELMRAHLYKVDYIRAVLPTELQCLKPLEVKFNKAIRQIQGFREYDPALRESIRRDLGWT